MAAAREPMVRAPLFLMGHFFRSGLHACDPGGLLVFLDVTGDRYFALAAEEREVCLRLVAGVPSLPQDTEIIDELIEASVIIRVDGDARPYLCEDFPCDATASADAGIGCVPILSVIAALARILAALVELKVRSLDRVLASIGAAKRQCATANPRDADVTAVATAFAKADRYISPLDLCLPRSIALARTMIATGIAPDLVLGVKLRPFEAHCWVQHGDTLVGEDLGAISPFTPIFVL